MAETSAETERIIFARAVAVIRPDSIAIRPVRARLIGPAIEGALAAAAVVTIVTLLPVLSLWVLVVLLLVAMLLGPIAVLGVVYNVVGSSVLVERKKNSVRYQQGFLGLGIGTAELVPFWRIARFEISSSDAVPLTSGERQELVEWEVRLVKDNGRVLPVASAVAMSSFTQEARSRAVRLAAALAEMTGATAEEHELSAHEVLNKDVFSGSSADTCDDATNVEPRRRRRRRAV